LDILEEKFWTVSDPDSKEYGKYMSVEEINELVRCDGDMEAVENWLRMAKITDVKRISNSLKVNTLL
jgi:hypothetical protein